MYISSLGNISFSEIFHSHNIKKPLNLLDGICMESKSEEHFVIHCINSVIPVSVHVFTKIQMYHDIINMLNLHKVQNILNQDHEITVTI